MGEAEAEVEIVSDGVFIETTTALQFRAFDQLSVAPQLSHPTTSEATGLDHSIQGHFHCLRPSEPVAIGIDHRLAQLDRRPAAIQGIGHKTFKQIVLKLSIRVQHQQPFTGELAQSNVESTRLTTASITLAMDHAKAWMAIGQLIQELWSAVLAAVIEHPGGYSIGWVAQRRQPFHQAGDHTL